MKVVIKNVKSKAVALATSVKEKFMGNVVEDESGAVNQLAIIIGVILLALAAVIFKGFLFDASGFDLPIPGSGGNSVAGDTIGFIPQLIAWVGATLSALLS